MKILTRYIIREHVGPFLFSFSALTALLLLNYLSRQLAELVGKGLPMSAILEFLMLSVPLTVALTAPMSVLVAVLYAFSRLAAENEVTAMKANGVSPWTLVSPAIIAGVVMSVLLLLFNDQVLPRANHQLKTLQQDISQTRPTLLLKEQIINPIVEGKFYLKAGRIDQSSGRMTDVVVYDLSKPDRRRTIYARTGRIAFDSDRVDLRMTLNDGQMQEVSTERPSQLNRLFFKSDRIRLADVGSQFQSTEADSLNKGDREMSVCEMQRRLWDANTGFQAAKQEYEYVLAAPKDKPVEMPRIALVRTPEPHGIGWLYCSLSRLGRVKTASAAEAPMHVEGDTIPAAVKATQDTSRSRQDTTKTTQGAVKTAQDAAQASQGPPVLTTPPPAPAVAQPVPVLVPGPQTPAIVRLTPEQVAAQLATIRAAQQSADQAAAIGRSLPSMGMGGSDYPVRLAEAKIRYESSQRSRNRYDIEIHKKFSLAAACLIFVLLGAPIAVRFPRGGVGLVIGVSLVVFALYYVGLIGGEALANKAIVPPFWAMWGMNVVMSIVGVFLLFRMGRDSGSARGGGLGEWWDNVRARRAVRSGRTVS